MMDRVVETTVTWHYHDKPKDKLTARYITAATAEYRLLAETIATSLTQEDIEATEQYRRACEEGTAVIVGRPKRKRLE